MEEKIWNELWLGGESQWHSLDATIIVSMNMDLERQRTLGSLMGIVKIASTGYFTIIGGNDFTQRTQLILTLWWWTFVRGLLKKHN